MFKNLPNIPFALLTHTQKQEAILRVLKMLEPVSVLKFKKIRVGGANDGGYVQVDDFKEISHAFSLGISDNDNWDLEVATRGIPVEQVDYSVDNAPSSHPNLRFHKKFASAEEGDGKITLDELVSDFSRTKKPDLLLKMDIEGSEWDILDSVSSEVLGKFAQIMCEFHWMQNLAHEMFFNKAERVFRKLNDQFAVIHVHGNNCCGIQDVMGIPIPTVLEFTFVNRKRFCFQKSKETFPTPLDCPNLADRPDIRLGNFTF